jgi:predicted benzoate:H+ symporter BenE
MFVLFAELPANAQSVLNVLKAWKDFSARYVFIAASRAHKMFSDVIGALIITVYILISAGLMDLMGED